MSRRPKQGQQFGSDSFMDVVCNVVGILIILMVLAGLRAGRAPVELAEIRPAEPASVEPVEAEWATDAKGIEPTLGDAVPLPVLPHVVEPLSPPSPPAELVAAADELQREVASLNADSDALGQELAAKRERQSHLEDKLHAARAAVEQRRAAWNADQQQRASTIAELASLRQTVSQLSSQLDHAEAVTPKAKQIEHRITPIGQEITGRELHFQVLHGRVAVIPLEKLIERLKDQIERRKDWLAKSRQHLGQVGPIDGFVMNYVIQRDNMSVVDELRYGQPGMYRISVANWQLQPERDLVAEPVAQAIQPGSRFYATLLEAGEGAALTFWVYPDSFSAFGELKQFCHTQNFLVAGRPLPAGQPISGSPTGSRSAGQ